MALRQGSEVRWKSLRAQPEFLRKVGEGLRLGEAGLQGSVDTGPEGPMRDQEIWLACASSLSAEPS